MLNVLFVWRRGPTTPVYTCRFSLAFRVRWSLPRDASRPPEASPKIPADVRRGPFWLACPGSMLPARTEPGAGYRAQQGAGRRPSQRRSRRVTGRQLSVRLPNACDGHNRSVVCSLRQSFESPLHFGSGRTAYGSTSASVDVRPFVDLLRVNVSCSLSRQSVFDPKATVQPSDVQRQVSDGEQPLGAYVNRQWIRPADAPSRRHAFGVRPVQPLGYECAQSVVQRRPLNSRLSRPANVLKTQIWMPIIDSPSNQHPSPEFCWPSRSQPNRHSRRRCTCRARPL